MLEVGWVGESDWENGGDLKMMTKKVELILVTRSGNLSSSAESSASSPRTLSRDW